MKTKLLLLVAVFGLLSCSGDDDSNNNNSFDIDNLYGVWGYYKGMEGNYEYLPHDGCQYISLLTLTRTEREAIYQGYNTSCQMTGVYDEASFMVDGNKLKITFEDDGELVYNISNLTETDLTLSEGSNIYYYRKY